MRDAGGCPRRSLAWRATGASRPSRRISAWPADGDRLQRAPADPVCDVTMLHNQQAPAMQARLDLMEAHLRLSDEHDDDVEFQIIYENYLYTIVKISVCVNDQIFCVSCMFRPIP